ncbi:MAG: hypothetical protein U9R54_04385 [Bacteroidota bacterium]|nr:hypothetical protein [Bacteroidota bacterium]
MISLSDQLLAECSRKNTDYIVSIIEHDLELLTNVIELLYSDIPYLKFRACWVLEILFCKHPEIASPHLYTLISIFNNTNNNSLRRHLTKILSVCQLSENQLGMILDRCFNQIQDSDIPVAVKIHSMQVIDKNLEYFPELKPEFIAILETHMNRNSAGFKARANKILKQLY